ncbi:hypothetical protein G5B30_16645 [Sphingobacterium sp. SGG-5]|nr:hypothetical protein [Sphingobacterium sp. SGG-5]NGM63540.1 hypothetical protein [Sphingobacterium sp. SGG-5]
MPKPKPNHDYTEAQELRNKGYSLVEISKMTVSTDGYWATTQLSLMTI